MAKTYLKFRGETLGEFCKAGANLGTTCNVSMMPKFDTQNGKPVPVGSVTTVSSAQQTSLTGSYIIDSTEDIGETLNFVVTEGKRLTGKEGVVTVDDGVIGTLTCTSLTWGGMADTKDHYLINIAFTGEGATGMQFFDELKNGNFESLDDSGDATDWTAAGTTGPVTQQLYGTEIVGTGQYCMILRSDTPTNDSISQLIDNVASSTGYEDYYIRLTVQCGYANPTTSIPTNDGQLTLTLQRVTTTKSLKALTTFSNRATKLSIAAKASDLYNGTDQIKVIIANTSTDDDVLIYVDNVTLECIHEGDL